MGLSIRVIPRARCLLAPIAPALAMGAYEAVKFRSAFEFIETFTLYFFLCYFFFFLFGIAIFYVTFINFRLNFWYSCIAGSLNAVLVSAIFLSEDLRNAGHDWWKMCIDYIGTTLPSGIIGGMAFWLLGKKSSFHNEMYNFIDSCDMSYQFQHGNEQLIITDSEEKFLHALSELERNSPDLYTEMTQNSTKKGSSSDILLVYALRNSLHAVHTNNKSIFKCSLMAVALATHSADFRDVLVSLSVIEFCAERLGINFKSETRNHLLLYLKDDDFDLCASYLKRSDEDKHINVMGYKASGDNKNLKFESNWDEIFSKTHSD